VIGDPFAFVLADHDNLISVPINSVVTDSTVSGGAAAMIELLSDQSPQPNTLCAR
jgi:hypothetical protein